MNEEVGKMQGNCSCRGSEKDISQYDKTWE